jgi:hypothetical protein
MRAAGAAQRAACGRHNRFRLDPYRLLDRGFAEGSRRGVACCARPSLGALSRRKAAAESDQDADDQRGRRDQPDSDATCRPRVALWKRCVRRAVRAEQGATLGPRGIDLVPQRKIRRRVVE